MQYKLGIDDRKNSPKPFLKWAGGKRKVVERIVSSLPRDIEESGRIEKYFEPFLGGGAVFFYLISHYDIDEVHLGDINKDLILTYHVVQKDPEILVDLLKSMSDDFLPSSKELRKEYYYNIRNEFNKEHERFNYSKYSDKHIIRASKMIFLNKTCFNGLFRVNKKCQFNVPMGSYKNPLICDKENIFNVSKVLQDVVIKSEDYRCSEKFMDENSFVYLDPPFRPLNKTSYFTNYSKNKFDDAEQKELCEFYKRVSEKHVRVVLSNSDPKNENKHDSFFEDLYGEFRIEKVVVRRYINANAKKRGPINELLIFNY